jgi:hypothetical protein
LRGCRPLAYPRLGAVFVLAKLLRPASAARRSLPPLSLSSVPTAAPVVAPWPQNRWATFAAYVSAIPPRRTARLYERITPPIVVRLPRHPVRGLVQRFDDREQFIAAFRGPKVRADQVIEISGKCCHGRPRRVLNDQRDRSSRVSMLVSKHRDRPYRGVRARARVRWGGHLSTIFQPGALTQLARERRMAFSGPG